MGRVYPDEFTKELKSRADIVQVVSQFVQLKQVGDSYWGACPFHGDKNPSLQVRPDNQLFGCFSCRAGDRTHSHVKSADVYGFLKGILNCNFGEAVEWLANFLNEPLPSLDPVEQKKVSIRQAWYQYCEKAAERFTHNLLNHHEAYSYLLHRGIGREEIVTWRLGFGDDADKEFLNVRDRIVFSAFDSNANIVSFTGRTLLPQEQLDRLNAQRIQEGKSEIKKYLDRYPVKGEEAAHHPFPNFDKANLLYGLHIAKRFISESRLAILVEGWTDVIKLHKHGQHCTVGTMGTALTEGHITLLKRAGARYVLIMRDGDEAGVRAAERDAKLLMQHGIIPYVLPLEYGLDPDSFCDTYGAGRREDLAKFIHTNKRTFTQWQLESIYQKTQNAILYHYSQITELQGTRMRSVIEYISCIQDPIEKDLYIRQASDLFSISYDSMNASVGHYNNTKTHMVGGVKS